MDMERVIREKLAEIENKENVRIIMAVESGSRAWGFASPDSDYDVRFVYVRKLEDYLKLDKTRDVIEWQLDDTLDISGWDLKRLYSSCMSQIRPFLSGVLHRSYTGAVRHSRNCRKSGKSIIPKRRACTITGIWQAAIMKTICRVKKYGLKSIFM